MSGGKNTPETPSFESSLAELEGIVAKMEGGGLPLDAMIRHFERGVALSRLCEAKLKDIERKIELLVSEDQNGGQWTEFPPGDAPTQNPATHDDQTLF
jgi:exodeoxyribonuclease VII small subunit